VIIAARLKVKGGSFRDLPLTKELAASLEESFAFLESVKGVRLRGGGVDFAGSPLIFPGRDGAPVSNQAFKRQDQARVRARSGAGHFRTSPSAYGRDAPAQRPRSQPA
jgi:hypothetical protein